MLRFRRVSLSKFELDEIIAISTSDLNEILTKKIPSKKRYRY